MAEQNEKKNDIEAIYRRLNDIAVLLSSIKEDLAMLEKVRDETINIYAKLDRLEGELEKLGKMMYWHRKATENQTKSTKKYYSTKKGGYK